MNPSTIRFPLVISLISCVYLYLLVSQIGIAKKSTHWIPSETTDYIYPTFHVRIWDDPAPNSNNHDNPFRKLPNRHHPSLQVFLPIIKSQKVSKSPVFLILAGSSSRGWSNMTAIYWALGRIFHCVLPRWMELKIIYFFRRDKATLCCHEKDTLMDRDWDKLSNAMDVDMSMLVWIVGCVIAEDFLIQT